MMEIQVQYTDDAFVFLQLVARSNRKWNADALKSTAWKVSSDIKKGIRSNAPGGKAYARLSLSGRKRRALEMVSHGNVKTRYEILGQLRQAIGYEGKKAPTGVVPVGWLSPSAAWLGDELQEGFNTDVTPKVRRLYFAAGIPLGRRKKQLHTPARPTLRPMLPQLSITAKTWFEKKMMGYLMGNSTRSKAATRRRYRVYSSRTDEYIKEALHT